MGTRDCARPAERAARAARRALGVAALALLVACAANLRREPFSASEPAALPGELPGVRIVSVAESLIGAPYRFGGVSRDGIDCSGLVVFAHAAVGLAVPRTVGEQRAAARPIAPSELAPGDLVFFHFVHGVTDHVGIYAGRGRFIHAPARGRVVSYGWLDDPYFASRYAGAGRFWVSPPRARAERAGP